MNSSDAFHHCTVTITQKSCNVTTSRLGCPPCLCLLEGGTASSIILVGSRRAAKCNPTTCPPQQPDSAKHQKERIGSECLSISTRSAGILKCGLARLGWSLTRLGHSVGRRFFIWREGRRCREGGCGVRGRHKVGAIGVPPV